MEAQLICSTFWGNNMKLAILFYLYFIYFIMCIIIIYIKFLKVYFDSPLAEPILVSLIVYSGLYICVSQQGSVSFSNVCST